jgi:hypothetical protein
MARLLHFDVRLLTSYREQSKVSSVRTRELFKGFWGFMETYQKPFDRSRKQVETCSLTYNMRFHISVHRFDLQLQLSDHKAVAATIAST